jgi:hypothetical protein
MQEDTMRDRTNIDCLGTDELHDLREALAEMYTLPASDPNSFAMLASFHGGPPTGYCRHGSPGFFTWHRAYLMAFENALRTVRCDVTVPYWDWSSGPSTGVPEPCRQPTYVNRAGATVANPLYRGPSQVTGGQTSRRPDIDTTAYDDLAATAQNAMTATTFTSFQSLISGVHGSVHVRTGGDMTSVPTAAYDPIFYLHHANVDRLWAEWQSTHPGSLPASEASFELPPFNRPFSTQWQQGSEVESTDALGYRYRRFCFFLPPIRLWETFIIDWPWVVRERMSSARLLVKSTRPQPRPVEIRAFLDQPGATEGTTIIGNPGFAGAVGFLGHSATHHPGAAHDCPVCAELGHTDEHPHATRHNGHGAEGSHDHGGHEPADGESHVHDHEPGHEHTHDHEPANGHVHGSDQQSDQRFDVEIELTAALRVADRQADKVALKLVAVDAGGRHVADEDVILDGIELVVD